MKKSARITLLALLTLALVISMMPFAFIASASGAQSVSGSGVATTPGVSENLRYFKEDTYYQMTKKVSAMTFEFELSGCAYIPGGSNGGVIVGNYGEDASTYINVEVRTYGQIFVRGKYNGGDEWTAQFYQSECDIRTGAVRHYTVTVGSGWAGVTLYVDGVSKATRYPASLTIPNASDFTNTFRIGGDYTTGNPNYFKGRINSVALYGDIRTADEINADKNIAKTWKSGDSLLAAYDVTRMGEAALRDYSGGDNKLVYVNGSGIQVENFGKYEIDKQITDNLETFETWIYMPKAYSSDIGGTVFGNYRSYNGARIWYEIYKNGNPRFAYTTASGTTSYHRFTDVDLRTDTWQHLAIVHDTANGEARCYVNGELKQTIADGTVAAYSADIKNQNFLIGRDTALRYAEGDGQYWENRADHYFKGFIKEIRVYSDVRSADEIAADYNGTLDTTDNSLVACYQITPDNAYEGIKDVSGNGYDATYKQLLWETEYIEPVSNDYAYTFAVVGDTQIVTYQNPERLKNIYQYILNNKDAMNIQYVIGLGDITEYGVDVGHTNYDETRANAEWAAAKAAISLMDGNIPYSLIRGDGHDGIELFNQYFANHSGYTDNITGYMEEGRIDNVYHTFKVGEVDYMILCLDHGTKDNAIEWANEVVASHPNHRVIVTTHHYLESDGTLSATGETGNATAYDPNNNAADVLWDEFISKHPNINMVLCGHASTDDVLVTKKTGIHGNEVTQIMINPQNMDGEYYHGSKGMVAMLHFSADGQNVQVEYYSTIKDTYRPSTSFTVSTGDHIPGDAVKKNEIKPDCINGGSYDLIVNCSKCGVELSNEHKTVDALGHKHEATVTAPTCTDKGYTTYTCTVCGDTYVGDEKAALGHAYDSGVVTVEPGCTTKGEKTFTCQNDSSHTYTEEISANGHTDGAPVTENNVAPTCTTAGGYDTVIYCTVCNTETSRVHTDVAANGHTEVILDAKAPTCTESGLTAGVKCSVCKEILTAQIEVPASGHVDENPKDYKCDTCGADLCTEHVEKIIPAKAATCTETGLTEGKQCSICGEVIVPQTVVDALGHTEAIDEAVPPTCTATGLTEGKHCSACNEVFVAQTVVAATGHTDGTPVKENNVDATCITSGGYDMVTYCTVCSTETSRVHTDVAALGHTDGTPVKENNVDATCTTIGGYDMVTYCTVCNAVTNTVHTDAPALGHTDGTPVTENNVEPTCTVAGGYDTVTYCTVCSTEMSRVHTDVAASGHKYGAEKTAPTCTEKGYTTYTCSICNDSYVADETAALGHRGQYILGSQPSCTESGMTNGSKCSVCGDIIVAQQEIPATGHSNTSVVTAPTCTAAGYTTYTCSVCGNSYVADEVDALGHSYETTVVAPTCTEGGYTTYACTACEDTYNADETEAKGHDWSPATTDAPKTCKNCGITEGDKLPSVTPNPDTDSETTPDADTSVEKDRSECEAPSIIEEILTAIVNFFRNLLGLPEICVCGDEL